MHKLWLWPWRYHPNSWYDCVINYQDPTWQWGVMAWTRIFSMCALWPWPWRYDLRSRSWHNLGSWTISVWNIFEIQHGSEELWPGHGFSVYMHCDIDLGQAWRYDLGSRSWHTLGSWTTIMWNIIQIKHSNEELWPGHRFSLCMHCDLDIGDMNLGQGYDTTLGHGQ